MKLELSISVDDAVVRVFDCVTKVLDFEKSFDVVIGKSTILQHRLLELIYCEPTTTITTLTPNSDTTTTSPVFIKGDNTRTISVIVHKDEVLTYENDGEEEIDDTINTQGEIPDYTKPRATNQDLIQMIKFDGDDNLQSQLHSLCYEYIDIFSTEVRNQPANVTPMNLFVDMTA